ncbi:hypothetical protein EV356DRAFT_498919 [Viridothelium virens]|uniref:Uncharacterized protein n=1 Tax=Viridothelium virens TaxID=1048519 RepID=A0A6A6HDB1_VIRVR|nr:hypothetical protein EV356DRAFT_498919 [Viridothelium virens]
MHYISDVTALVIFLVGLGPCLRRSTKSLTLQANKVSNARNAGNVGWWNESTTPYKCSI